MRTIPKFTIDRAASRLDYYGYIPYRLINDLCAAVITYRLHGKPYNDESSYSESMRQLLDIIDFEWVSNNTVLESAIKLLKTVFNRLDLRAVEGSSKALLEVEFTTGQQNYAVDVDNLSPAVYSMLNIDGPVDNTTVLPQDVLDVLEFYQGITITNSGDIPFMKESYIPIPSYSKISRIKKHKLLDLDFAYKLIKRSYEIEDEVTHYSEHNTVHIFVDSSPSVKQADSYIRMYKAMLLTYVSVFETNPGCKILLHFFASSVFDVVEIDSLDKLEELIHKPLATLKIDIKDASKTFEHIALNNIAMDIVFMTDSKLDISPYWIQRMSQTLFHILVVGEASPSLSKMAIKSHGNLIKL